jgi:predicted aconitase
VPYSKLHRDEARAVKMLFDVGNIPNAIRSGDLFYHLLGHFIGRNNRNLVPAILGLSDDCNEDDLKAISAAGSSSGSVPMSAMTRICSGDLVTIDRQGVILIGAQA